MIVRLKYLNHVNEVCRIQSRGRCNMKTREITSLVLTCILIVGMYPAFASDTSSKAVGSVTTVNTYGNWNTNDYQVVPVTPADVCIFTPYDSYMDSNLSSIILDEIQSQNLTAKVVSISDQIEQNYFCGHIIKIDRAINENYAYTDKTTKFIINGNSATIFAYKTAAPFNPAHVPSTPMSNLSCELEAHAEKYFSNFAPGKVYIQYGYCDPYVQSSPEKVGELPVNVIQNSVDEVLKNFKL